MFTVWFGFYLFISPSILHLLQVRFHQKIWREACIYCFVSSLKARNPLRLPQRWAAPLRLHDWQIKTQVLTVWSKMRGRSWTTDFASVQANGAVLGHRSRWWFVNDEGGGDVSEWQPMCAAVWALNSDSVLFNHLGLAGNEIWLCL